MYADIGVLIQKFRLLALALLKITEYVFDQNHGGIDDDTEIHGAYRKQVSRISRHDQNDDTEKQRKRNIHPDYDRAAQIAQKYPLDQEYQQTAEDEIMQYRVRGDRHQRRAVVIRIDFDTRRQGAVAIDFSYFVFNCGHDLVGLHGTIHHDYRRHHIVVAISAGLTQSGRETNLHFSHVLDEHRRAVGLRQHDIADIVHILDQTDTADINGLLTEIDGAAADIDVRVTQSGQ